MKNTLYKNDKIIILQNSVPIVPTKQYTGQIF